MSVYKYQLIDVVHDLCHDKSKSDRDFMSGKSTTICRVQDHPSYAKFEEMLEELFAVHE